VTASIPWTFVGWSCVALIVQALLVVSLARSSLERPTREPPTSPTHEGTPWIVGCLFLGHCLTMRTSGQLLLDPFCGALVLGAAAASLRLVEGFRGAWAALLFLIQVLGAFTKVSYLPALAIPALVLKVKGASWPRALSAGVVHGAVPLALVLVFIALVPGRESAGRDFAHLANAWRLSPQELRHFAIEMALLFQVWPLVLFVRRRQLLSGRALLACAALVLASTWAFKLPAVPRLYLPVLGLGLAGAAGAVDGWLGARRARVGLVVLIAANYAVAIWGTFRVLLDA